jgi:hypothetical protein
MSDLVPVWLLDVDGVLNAIAKKPDPSVWPKDTWLTGTARAGGKHWPILAAQPVLDFVLAVHSAGAAEIRWHTTWQSDAQGALSTLLGLPQFPLTHSPEASAGLAPLGGSSSGYGEWWKLPAAQRVLSEEGRRLLWTDDDLAFEATRAYWSSLPLPLPPGLAADRSSLLISPRENLGLTRRHLADIADFLGCSDLLPA